MGIHVLCFLLDRLAGFLADDLAITGLRTPLWIDRKKTSER